jgi:multiple sugar transport system substrate-binding protein
MTLLILAPNDPAIAALQEAFASHPEVDARVEIIPWENYRETLDACLAAPKATHQAVCVPGHIWLPQLAADGLLAPLDVPFSNLSKAVVSAYQPDGIFESVAAECRYNGLPYELPLFTDGHIVFYRSDLISLPDLVRPSEWHLLLENLKLPKGVSALAMKAHSSEILLDWLPYLWDFGGAVVDVSGKPVFDSVEGVRALKYYTSLRRFAPLDSHQYGNGEILAAMCRGKAAVAVSWGGQAAAMFDPQQNPYASKLRTAALACAWNATWGVSLPANQPADVTLRMTEALLRVMGPACDQAVTRIAGSPVRMVSYSASEKARYPWLASQERLLADCRTLPADPTFGPRLGPLYNAVHSAYTGAKSAEEALHEAAQ